MVAVLAHGAGEVPVSRLAHAWSAPASILVGAVVLLVLFLQAWMRLRRRGRADHAGWDRLALFLAALALGSLALVSPLDAVGEDYLISAHMLQHVLIGDAAPALALVALRGPLLFFLLPPVVLGPVARLRWLRRGLAALVRPKPALAIWIVVFALWHVPRVYDFVLTRPLVHDLEHLLFVVAGILVWTQLVDPARRRELSVARRLLVAACLFAAGTVLSYVLIFTLHPLYPAYAAQDTRLWGISPRLDQQLAGLVMMVEQTLTLGTCAFLLLRGRLRRGVAIEEREHALPRVL
jgi:cytochrome c oxidase assembly factor CtaG